MSNEEKIRVGRRLRELREARGWTQEMAAERLGAALDTIGRLERDKHLPSLTLAVRLARVYGVSIDAIVWPAKSGGDRLSAHDAGLLVALKSLTRQQRSAVAALIVALAAND